MRPWSVQDSEELYMTPAWGRGYFRVGANGHIQVTPRGEVGPAIDLYELVVDLVDRGLHTPLLLRFPDVLADRIAQIRGSFDRAIEAYDYRGEYRGVFPVKVNQQCQVVEEILEFGRDSRLGLEAGSKPELMIALAMHAHPDALYICNGIKDREYIELAFLAKKLGKKTIVVADRLEELKLSIELAQELGVRPRIGVRARLFSRGAGKWVESTGEKSKFGLSAVELLEGVRLLEAAGMLDCLELLHFHIGSQITDIRALKLALREASRVYVELAALGAPMGILDVGGGLGVDYDGSQTNFHSSMNYSMQEYANDVVYAIQDACDAQGIEHPILTSESGRAIVAHHSILIADVVGVAQMPSEDGVEEPSEDAPQCFLDLWEIWTRLSRKNLIECYHDAQQIKDEAQSLFSLGFLDLAGRAACERLFWAVMRRVLRLLAADGELPEQFEALPRGLADIYYCNWSTFQSTPDHWAVKQLFPTMPIHRLETRPDRLAILADLTCDSDGKMDRFIDHKGVADFLHLHSPGDEPYYIGFFLVGAYQEVLGDLHNLFGDTNAVHVRVEDDGSLDVGKVVEGDSVREVLSYVQYDPEQMVQSVRRAAEKALREKRITKADVQSLLGLYKTALGRTTYLAGG